MTQVVCNWWVPVEFNGYLTQDAVISESLKGMVLWPKAFLTQEQIHLLTWRDLYPEIGCILYAL